ncbi:MAG TPA: ankyrin repeat domain-containing protein, partial [bacterium]|nr:ankyrin repeat domain-containing protein [bacterium]
KGLNTALHYAASRGFVKAASLLIRKGVSLNDKDDKGRTPMVRAQFTGNYDIVDMLKRAGAYE